MLGHAACCLAVPANAAGVHTTQSMRQAAFATRSTCPSPLYHDIMLAHLLPKEPQLSSRLLVLRQGLCEVHQQSHACTSAPEQASSLVADEVDGAAHVDINKGDVASVLDQLGTACHGISIAPADLQQQGERQDSDSLVVWAVCHATHPLRPHSWAYPVAGPGSVAEHSVQHVPHQSAAVGRACGQMAQALHPQASCTQRARS